MTLIELLVTVAIVAILAGIAVPSYQEYIRRANRADAKSVLLETAQFLERNYTTNGCYHRTDASCTTAAATAPGNVTLPYSQSPRSGTAKYAIAVSYSTTAPCTLGQCFSLTATPTGGYADPDCGTLGLTQAGAQSSSSGTAADCWQN
ncbi:MAG: type IV pilin protein [Pseudomonadota bacterium]